MPDITPEDTEDPEVLAHAAESTEEEAEPVICGLVYASN
jgi:hypothetical protein